ncbi:hypothetical protein [Candidatus Nitrosotenuis uzonensis]|uniref:Uncharacterized protein n=1 Tax=Candidatus Nitrosotenuis uzonensis TaxID=1407055 RepID=A0A812EYZ9_9ARCH|nr:hypothetical protein [Candidatus Nitrosotenuis uzonensis]CAE6486071.1 hypothetical protein NUZ5A_20090 [Candidatus Nitrosotenuis uzonensis]
MTYQILKKQNQQNVSKDKQQIRAQRLAAAKNYLEQQLELAGQKKTILLEKHDSLVLFCDEQQKILASVQRGVLQVFFEIRSGHEWMQHRAHFKAVLLEGIQSQKALYCKRCKKWLEFHDGLTRCRCGKYLKTRKRFYIDKNQIENSDELAEIQFAKQDMKIAEKIESNRTESKKRRKEIVLSRIDTSITHGWIMKRHQEPPAQLSYLAEKVILKVHGHIVPEECKAAAIRELCGMVPLNKPLIIQKED